MRQEQWRCLNGHLLLSFKNEKIKHKIYIYIYKENKKEQDEIKYKIKYEQNNHKIYVSN